MKQIQTIVLVVLFSSAVLAQTMPQGGDPALWARALKIQRSSIVVDGHNDITSPMVDEDFDLGTNSLGKFRKDGDPFQTDLSRLKAGGLTGAFFAIYVSGSTLKTGGAMRRAMDLIDATYRETEKYPSQLRLCTTAAEIRQAKRQGKICTLMGMEGSYAIENSLYALRNFYRLGVRYMTLTHNVSNDWADAHNDVKKNNGLSDFGKEVVREMNRLGMFVDISHVSEKVMNDVLDITRAPVIASHSSARALNDHTRNVSDDVLRRVAKNGGVIMVNFYPSFLDARTNKEENECSARLRPQIEALRNQFKDDPEGFNAAERKLLSENPIYVAPYTRIVDHIDQIRKVAGIDNVGLGSDFDGVPFLPAGMNGAEDLALVTYEMLRRGYTETEVKKVLGENVLRAMDQMQRIAGKRQISAGGSLKKLAPPKIAP